MHLDVEQMAKFYAQPLGQHMAHILRHHIHDIWPDLRGERLLAYGYGLPYLKLLSRNTDRIMAFSPAQMGVSRWESGDGNGENGPGNGNCAALVDAEALPLPDNAVDRLFLVHALEYLGSAELALAEFWRVLSPGGRILLIIPNRTSLWAATDSTPFGYGAPFSRRQVVRLLRTAGFEQTGLASALYFPPVKSRRLLATLRPIERVGRLLWPKMAGAIIIEAEKKVFAGTRAERSKRASRDLQPAVSGLVSQKSR